MSDYSNAEMYQRRIDARRMMGYVGKTEKSG